MAPGKMLYSLVIIMMFVAACNGNGKRYGYTRYGVG